MKVSIVGHGPSLKGSGLGDLIDAYDHVVRMKNCGDLLKEPGDYGLRTDFMCSSTEVLRVMKVKALQYWGYPKYGTYNKESVEKFAKTIDVPLLIPHAVCNAWNDYFRSLTSQHPNYSTGMAAIVIACHYLRPEEIYLAGFDTLLNPEIKYSSTVETPWNKNGNYPNHDWKAENKMLDKLRETYQVNIH
jgi:Glycosyltransferase family 29 (sialyltransferase)